MSKTKGIVGYMINQFVLIVDAYSTGAKLAPKFRAQGLDCIHVQSNAHIPPAFAASFRSEDFSGNLVYRGDLHACAAGIEALGRGRVPYCVLAGTESGVELADALAHHWGLASNEIELSRARRDKYQMAQALKDQTLATPKFCLAPTLQHLLDWSFGLSDWPVVVKPPASAGNDSVFFCNTEDELKNAFQHIHGQVNELGIRNEHVLAQSYLRGTQYVVNTVSIDGQHYVTDIWSDRRKIRPGASNVYDREDLLPRCGATQLALTAYVESALSALGIRNGPAHSEVMLTADGPVLIETAARMQGAMLEEPVIAATGESQVTLTVERYCKPDRFRKRIGTDYPLRKHVICVALISENSGTVTDLSGLDRIRALPSFSGIFHTPEIGEVIRRTVDIFTIPGVVYICHEDPNILQQDYDSIRALEAAGQLFGLDGQ
jgi:biotin carboxylase